MRAHWYVVKIGVVASVAGGLLWVVKGGVILAVGDQPPMLFEIAGLLFPVALLGLHGRLDGDGGRPARIGALLASVATATALIAGAYALSVADPAETVVGIAIASCAVATVVGLVLLGVAARSTDALPPRWRNLPFAMGVAAVPAMSLLAGTLEAIHERLIELPVVAYGLAWVLLGLVLLSPRGVDGGSEQAANPADRAALS